MAIVPVVIPPIPQVAIVGTDGKVAREWWRWFDALVKRQQSDEEQLVLQALSMRLVT